MIAGHPPSSIGKLYQTMLCCAGRMLILVAQVDYKKPKFLPFKVPGHVSLGAGKGSKINQSMPSWRSMRASIKHPTCNPDDILLGSMTRAAAPRQHPRRAAERRGTAAAQSRLSCSTSCWPEPGFRSEPWCAQRGGGCGAG